MVEVDPTDNLYRRLLEYYVKPDDSISSAAFMDKGKPDPRCSVYLARLTTPVEVLSLGVANQRVAVLEAGAAIGLGLEVEHDGVGHPSHCLIKGLTSKAQCKSLALKCRLVSVARD